jgi:hypothetical protein
VACAEVIRQMCRHGVGVMRDQDALLALRPQEELRVLRTKRQVVGIADAHCI